MNDLVLRAAAAACFLAIPGAALWIVNRNKPQEDDERPARVYRKRLAIVTEQPPGKRLRSAESMDDGRVDNIAGDGSAVDCDEDGDLPEVGEIDDKDIRDDQGAASDDNGSGDEHASEDESSNTSSHSDSGDEEQQEESNEEDQDA